MDQHQIAVPSAMGQNDFAMNVPSSFDQRYQRATEGLPGSSRLNSNHLLLHQGVTNPIGKDYQTNKVTPAYVRMNKMLEEDG